MIICNLKSHPSWKGRKSILKGHLTSRSVFAVMLSRGKEGTQDLELSRSPPSLKAKNTLFKGGYSASHFMYLLFRGDCLGDISHLAQGHAGNAAYVQSLNTFPAKMNQKYRLKPFIFKPTYPDSLMGKNPSKKYQTYVYSLMSLGKKNKPRDLSHAIHQPY